MTLPGLPKAAAHLLVSIARQAGRSGDPFELLLQDGAKVVFGGVDCLRVYHGVSPFNGVSNEDREKTAKGLGLSALPLWGDDR